MDFAPSARAEELAGLPGEYARPHGAILLGLENGAPVDLFAAANVSYIDQLEQKGLIIPDTKAIYARGGPGAVMANTVFERLPARTLGQLY